MPYGLSFMGNVAGDTGSDPALANLNEFLATLETARPPEPHKLKTWQRVLGTLGDAIQAMATVRAGGAPPQMGAFSANEMARQQQERELAIGTEAANRDLRNRVRIGAFEEGLRGQREENIARIRAQARTRALQLKQVDTVDEAGRPVRVPYNYDPNSGTLSAVPGNEAGFERYVRPFLAQGVNTETGELEYRLVDPFTPLPSTGSTARGGGSKRVPGIEPKPTTAEAESVESASVIKGQLSEFKELSSQYAIRKRASGTVRALGQTAVRKLPAIGQELSETYGDPDFEKLSALRNRIGQQLARLVENGRLSDEDRDFALENLPTVVSLTTEEGRQQAGEKIALVEREIEARMARKRRLRPALTGGGAAPTVDDILNQYDEEIRRANPAP